MRAVAQGFRRHLAPALTPERRTGHALLVLCLVAYAFVIPRGAQHNADSRLALTYALVERGTLWVDGYTDATVDRAVRDGHLYTDKAPGISLWLVPFYAALRLLPLPDAGLPASERFVTRYALTFLGIGVPHAAFAVWLFHWLRRRAPAVGARAAVVVGYALGTPAYMYSVHAYGHVPAGVCLFVGSVLLGAGRSLLGGALLAAAVAFEYPAAVPAALLVGIELWRVRASGGDWRRRAVAGAMGVVLVMVPLALYHTLAFGAPWLTGYAFVDPAGPFATTHTAGLAGIGLPQPAVVLELLAGAERGLLTVAPWLLLTLVGGVWAWRTARFELARAAAVLGPLLAINGGYAVWDGGASWGPRHLVAALPFVALLALPVVRRWWALSIALIALSVAVTLVAVSTGTMPPAGASAYGDFLLPALRDGAVGNTLGVVVGRADWRALVALAWVALACWCWATGVRRAYGAAVAIALALLAAAQLDGRYVEYAEGYYLYLGSRVAEGAALYRDAESTQTPGLTLLLAALWRLLPGVHAPRVLALGCFVLAALLAGRLAERLAGRGAGPLGAAIAALLPLGASTPYALDANAVLAPLAVALALCVGQRQTRVSGAVRAAMLAAAGIAVKLTFVPLVLAPLIAAPRKTWQIAAATLALTAAVAAVVFAWAGPAAVDALTGELESPLLPAGALLAAFQFIQLQGFALALAGIAIWRLRHDVTLRPAHAVAIGALLLPLLAIHQGTFVSVARPAEPLIAAYAAAGIFLLAESAATWSLPVRLMLLACAAAFPLSALLQAAPRAGQPTDAPLAWIERYARPAEAILAPPFYAARAERAMLFDYADWTVLGMRAAAGLEPERTYATELVDQLGHGALPFVVVDFRLAYVPGAWTALETGYTRVETDGAGALEVSLWLPKRDAAR